MNTLGDRARLQKDRADKAKAKMDEIGASIKENVDIATIKAKDEWNKITSGS